MNTYLIREENMERLEKKLAAVQKKCNATKCSFHYEITNTIFKDCKDDNGNEYTAKYFEVTVEGKAQYNGWRFVATLDHHTEGNVIRAFDREFIIPDKYKTCDPTCEHCNKIRSRKDTYLVYNDETKEFKQVGKSCLRDFTNGLSAEDVAMFCQWYEAMENSYGYSGPNFNRYIDVEHILRYAFECYKHWGYQKSESSFEGEIPVGYRSTRSRVTDYYYINRCLQEEQGRLRAEMNEVGFNPDSEYAVSTTAAALEWIRNEADTSTEYIRNLHVICTDQYTDYRSLGILVSLTVAYARHMDEIAAYEKKQKAHEEEVNASSYVGNIGDKITVNCTSCNCVSSWANMYGVTYLYNFKDTDGNVFIWYASKCIDDAEDKEVATISGTVKDHSEYNGVKQTVLTRCKATYNKIEKKEEEHAPGSNEVQDALDQFFEYVNAE